MSLHRKPYFLFLDVLKIWSFQKNCAGIWSFLYYRERPCFFFPKIWSDTLDGQWKMIFLKKKIHGNMTFSSNFLKRRSFQKGPRRDMIFLVLSGKMVFFPENMIFFLEQKVRDNLSQKIYGNIFSVCTHGCYKHGATPFCQKNSKMVLSRKNTPKGDWRSRLTS